MTQRLWITSTVTAGLLLGSTAPALATYAPTTAGTTTTTAASRRSSTARTPCTSEGNPALARNAQIDALAAAWAEHMATTGQFQHNPDFFRQIPAGGRTAGENIAMNSYDPLALSTQWQNSPPHRDNILNPELNQIGMGVVQIGMGVVEHGGLHYRVQCSVGADPRRALSRGGQSPADAAAALSR